MGEKKKHKDRDRSQQRDKRRSKKKRQEKSKQKQKQKKRRSQKKGRSESQSSSDSSSSSSSDRSRSREKNSKKKRKDREKEKEDRTAINIPFQLSQTTPTLPANLITAIRPVGSMIIPPPAPTATATTSTSKPKTKQSHIFKFLPKLSLGAVTIGRTIYSSSLFSSGFENKMLNELCEQLQKSAKSEGPKKITNMINKLKQEINVSEGSADKKNQNAEEHKNKNLFQSFNQIYQQEVRKLRQPPLRSN